MRYYINDRPGKDFKYIVQTKELFDRDFREVEAQTFKIMLGCRGIDYELPEDKIATLQTENANLILENITKDLKIEALESENANLLLAAAEQELRLTQAEADIASLMLELGGM